MSNPEEKDIADRIHRCCNCGNETRFPCRSLRILYSKCALCGVDFDSMDVEEGTKKFVPNPLPEIPECAIVGPQHLAFQISVQTIQVIAASLGSLHKHVEAVDFSEQIRKVQDPDGSIILEEGASISEMIGHEKFEKLADLLEQTEQQCFLTILIAVGKTESRRWRIILPVSRLDGTLLKSLLVRPPPQPFLKVLPSSFVGHRSNPSQQYKCADIIQAVIDLTDSSDSVHNNQSGLIRDGSYLSLDTKDPWLLTMTGDPFIAGAKILSLDIDLTGFLGEICIPVASGYVQSPIEIHAPVLAPQLVVTEAIITSMPNGRDALATLTEHVQQYIDSKCQGAFLLLKTDRSIFKVLLYDQLLSLPQEKLFLVVRYFARGIKGQKSVQLIGGTNPVNDLLIKAPDLTNSRCSPHVPRSRGFGFVQPRVIIRAASYGTQYGARYPSRVDCKSALQRRVDDNGGAMLKILTNEHIDSWFNCSMTSFDSTFLKISYEIQSFCTHVEIPIKPDNTLFSAVRIGYEAQPICTPMPIDFTSKMREANSLNMSEHIRSARTSGLYDNPTRRATGRK